MISEDRDLIDDEAPEYPSHIQLREFDYENRIARLWLGNENAGEECDVSLTTGDVEWMIDVLQRILRAKE